MKRYDIRKFEERMVYHMKTLAIEDPVKRAEAAALKAFVDMAGEAASEGVPPEAMALKAHRTAPTKE